MSITVRGKCHTWSFDTYADPQHLEEWQADGVDIGIIENSIPEWVVDAGLLKVWIFFQDIWNFKNPFKK